MEPSSSAFTVADRTEHTRPAYKPRDARETPGDDFPRHVQESMAHETPNETPDRIVWAESAGQPRGS